MINNQIITLFKEDIHFSNKDIPERELGIEHFKVDRTLFERAELVRYISDDLRICKIFKDRYTNFDTYLIRV